MPAYDEYPQFDGLSSSEILHLIIETRLSRTDIQIAASRLVWGMEYADIRFNADGHNVVEKLIESCKNSEEYKRNPEYANGMLDAWKAIHAEMRAQSAKVAAMINQYK